MLGINARQFYLQLLPTLVRNAQAFRQVKHKWKRPKPIPTLGSLPGSCMLPQVHTPRNHTIAAVAPFSLVQRGAVPIDGGAG